MLIAQEQTGSWTVTWLVMLTIGLLLIASGIALKAIAERTARGTLERNPWAGVRTKATMASDDAWQHAHQAAKRESVFGGWTFIASGAVSPVAAAFTSDADKALTIWSIMIVSGTVLATVLMSIGGWRGHQAAKSLAINGR